MPVNEINQIPLVAVAEARTNSCLGSKSATPTLKIEAFFLRYRDHFVVLHIAMMLLFLTLIFLPLFLPEPAENATPFNHFTLFSNYIMWGIWFPLVFLSVIFSGRSWCGLLCPMGAASEWANKVGLKKKVPAFIRWEGMPILSFLLITLLGQTVGVRDHPEAIAEVFGGIMLAAIIVGFVWGNRKRVWCRHFCPIGLLLGLFSRLGAVQFRPQQKKAGGEKYAERGLCPTMIDIMHKEESRHCIECFRCVHPKSKKGIRLRLRKPGEEIEQILTHNPNIFEVWFFFLGTGIALGGFLWLILPEFQVFRQVLGEWFIENGWYWVGESGPAWLMSVHPERREVFNWLDFMAIVGFMLGIMVVFSAILYSLNWLATRMALRLGAMQDSKTVFITLAYQFMPVAMVALVVGIGGKIFDVLSLFGVSAQGVVALKAVLFFISFIWSLWLGFRILDRLEINGSKRFLPLSCSAVGSLFIVFAWWPAIFGL